MLCQRPARLQSPFSSFPVWFRQISLSCCSNPLTFFSPPAPLPPDWISSGDLQSFSLKPSEETFVPRISDREALEVGWYMCWMVYICHPGLIIKSPHFTLSFPGLDSKYYSLTDNEKNIEDGSCSGWKLCLALFFASWLMLIFPPFSDKNYFFFLWEFWPLLRNHWKMVQWFSDSWAAYMINMLLTARHKIGHFESSFQS